MLSGVRSEGNLKLGYVGRFATTSPAGATVVSSAAVGHVMAWVSNHKVNAWLFETNLGIRNFLFHL